MLETVFDIIENVKAGLETLLFNSVLPVVFKVMLIGMQITLAWAFYQTGAHIIEELF